MTGNLSAFAGSMVWDSAHKRYLMIWRKSFVLRWVFFLGFCVLAITVLANNETHLPYSPTAFSGS